MNQKCLQCGYEWEARVENPKECPYCKVRNWNIQNGGKQHGRRADQTRIEQKKERI